MSQDTKDGSEVIGYALNMPWMQEVFAPTNTMRQRICLPCYAPKGGVRLASLTRQRVEAECASLRAQGMTNFGGKDLCWRVARTC